MDSENGEISGSVGYDKRMESLEIRLVAKNGAAPGSTGTPNHILQGVSYSSYVEGQGWKTAENGAECGTTGQAKRMESLRLSVVDSKYSGGVTYSAYVQSYGWQPEASNGGNTGTEGSGKRMEAIKIRLTGELAEHYDIYYQVHVQSIGWMDWAKNGEVAGTYNNSKRIESFKVCLVEKGKAAPGNTAVPSYAYNLKTETFAEGIGWMSAGNGVTCGTTGQSRRLEAFKVSVSDDRYSGGIQYQAYMQGSGWNPVVENGAEAGLAGSGKRMEAVKINLTGELAEKYHIYYRAYVQSYGWLGWAADGTPAGTANFGKRMEAVQIMMVPKVLAAPGVLRDAYISDIYGIDVSAHNGNVIWSSVRSYGTEFAMLRVTTKNLQKDTTFEANYKGAVSNGIRVGVYKYGYATTVEEAREEARSVLRALNGRPLSFPVAYDVEDSVQQVLGKEKLNQIIDAFQAEIENAGYKFMLYTNLNWLNNVLDAQHFADEDIWIARYRSFGLGHGYTGPGNVTMWQFTSVGQVPGVSGNVDRNVAYKMY